MTDDMQRPRRTDEDDALLRLNDLAAVLDPISAGYAAHYGIMRDRDWMLLKLHEEMGELTAEALRLDGRKRGAGDPERLADEVADVLGQLLCFAHGRGIDIDAAIRRKWLAMRDRYRPVEERPPVPSADQP